MSFKIPSIKKEDLKAAIEDFLKSFSKTYLSEFKTAIVESAMEEDEEEEKLDLQLSSAPEARAPEKSGTLKRQSTIRKSWKEAYFFVEPNYELSYAAAADKKKQGTINLWGYKTQMVNVRPKGKRRGGPEWEEDESRATCKGCDEAFTFTNRRHHCRACGGLFDDKCTLNRVPLPHYGYPDAERVCKQCFDEVEATRARGTSIAVTQPEETKEDTEFFGIQLLHATRTPYILEAADEEDRKAWIEVLNVCCKNATEPRNQNSIQAAAFEAAHREASRDVGFRGGWKVTGSEEEMISELLFTVVFRKVLQPAIDAIPGDKLNTKFGQLALNTIKKQGRLAVNLAVGPAWTAVLAGLNKVEELVRPKLAEVVAPVKKFKAEMREKLSTGILDAAKGPMDKVAGPTADKLISTALKPIIAMFGAAFRVFADVGKQIAAKVSSEDDLEKETGDAEREALREYGFMWPITEKSRELSRDLRDVQKSNDHLASLPVSGTINQLASQVSGLLRNAFYTLRETAKSNPSQGGVEAAVKDTMGKLQNDAVIVMLSSFKGFLVAAILPPVGDAVLDNPAVKAVIDPIDSLVPSAIADFVSVRGLVDDTLADIVVGLVDQFVDGTRASAIEGIETMAKDVSV